MSEQLHPQPSEDAAQTPSGLLLSVEPLAAAAAQFDDLGGDKADTDADGQDTGDAAGDADGTDGAGEPDADGSDEMDADGTDASGDADSTDAR